MSKGQRPDRTTTPWSEVVRPHSVQSWDVGQEEDADLSELGDEKLSPLRVKPLFPFKERNVGDLPTVGS